MPKKTRKMLLLISVISVWLFIVLIGIAYLLFEIRGRLTSINDSLSAIAQEPRAKLEREKQNEADRERIHGDFLKREAENAYLKKLEES